jgi:hypothetical protein
MIPKKVLLDWIDNLTRSEYSKIEPYIKATLEMVKEFINDYKPTLTPTAAELKEMLDAGKVMRACYWEKAAHCIKMLNKYMYQCRQAEEMDGAWNDANGKTEWEEYHQPQEEQHEKKRTCETCKYYNPTITPHGSDYSSANCYECNSNSEWEEQQKLLYADAKVKPSNKPTYILEVIEEKQGQVCPECGAKDGEYHTMLCTERSDKIFNADEKPDGTGKKQEPAEWKTIKARSDNFNNYELAINNNAEGVRLCFDGIEKMASGIVENIKELQGISNKLKQQSAKIVELEKRLQEKE